MEPDGHPPTLRARGLRAGLKLRALRAEHGPAGRRRFSTAGRAAPGRAEGRRGGGAAGCVRSGRDNGSAVLSGCVASEPCPTGAVTMAALS